MEILTLREQLPGPSKLEIWHLNCLNHSDLKCLAVCKVASNINVKKNGRTAAAGRAETMWEKRFSEGNQESPNRNIAPAGDRIFFGDWLTG